MPAIDLARLRKQAARLGDFFFLPSEFVGQLREVLEFYVNHSLRARDKIAPGSNLGTYRTPPVVLREIENSLQPVAFAHPIHALDLADELWAERSLETALLAAFLLACLPPQELLLVARLTAWTQQVRDPQVREVLLTRTTSRMRAEAPAKFLEVVREWLHPERQQTWSNGIQALLPFVASTGYDYMPAVLEIVAPVLREWPAKLQPDLEELVIALHSTSESETLYFLRRLLLDGTEERLALGLRRGLTSLPAGLQSDLRHLLRDRGQRPPDSTVQGGV